MEPSTKKKKKEISWYHSYIKYLDWQAWANSVDPDQMLQTAASDLGLYCLPIIEQFLDTSTGINP